MVVHHKQPVVAAVPTTYNPIQSFTAAGGPAQEPFMLPPYCTLVLIGTEILAAVARVAFRMSSSSITCSAVTATLNLLVGIDDGFDDGRVVGRADDGRVVGLNDGVDDGFIVGAFVGAVGELLGMDELGLDVGEDGTNVGFNEEGV